jgi:short-subunit dehydrogenase
MFDVPLDNRIEYVHTRDVGLALANAASSDEIWGMTLHIGGGPRCQLTYAGMIGPILDAMGIGRLPPEAFATAQFATDWLDTGESQRLLRFQTRGLDDYVRDMSRLLGPRRLLVRLFRPMVRRALLRRSPHWMRLRTACTRLPCHGKVALITGASSGIGAASARQLARQGLKVVLVARRGDRLERLAAEIRRDGGEAWVIVADLADEREPQRVLREAAEVAGPVDVLVNGAGFGWYGYGSDMPWTLALQMIQTNLTAAAHLTLMALQDMNARGGGHIINISSVAGSLPEQGIALYAATKSFLDSFTTSLHRESRGTGVSVSVVRPGAVRTEFYDLAAGQPSGLRIPGQRFAVSAEAVGRRVAALVRRPRRVAYVPNWLQIVPWVEPAFGWLIDRLGPALLRRQRAAAKG